MRLSYSTMAFAIVCASVWAGTATVSLAQATPEEIRVDMSLKDADMLLATKLLTAKTGLQFVIEPSADPFPKITLDIKNQTASEAIKYICQSAGVFWRRDENGVYIISRNAPKTVETAIANPPAVDVIKPMVVRKIKVRKADAKAVLNQILHRQPENPLAQFELLQKFTNMSNPTRTNMLGNGPSVIGGGAQPVSAKDLRADSNGSIILPGEGSAQGEFGGGGFGGGARGGQGGGGLQGGGGGLQGGAGGNAQLTPGQGFVPAGIDQNGITYDPTDGSIVVRGTEEAIAELQRMIQLFDVAPRQVVVKVEFITTSSSINKALGFDWLYQRGTIFAGNRPGSFVRSGDPIFINYATGNVTSRMRTLLQEGYGKTVQAPVLRTLNNQPATVNQQVQTSVFVNQVVSVGNGQVINAPQLVQFTITTGLSVAPRINDDDTITVFINVPVQDFGQLRRGPDGQEVPDVLSQTISVVARVKNGETIALGGLTRKSDQGSQSKFPILGDLPIVGQFFRSTTKDRNNTELIIFVTPTIVPDDNAGLGP